MSPTIDIWKIFAGIAFFLLAMDFMEGSLKILTGRGFKLFIRRHTTKRIKAVGVGAIVTSILQSSSISNLIVLGMVGSGIVAMENALALMLGSNLGSTFNTWLIALGGFEFKIENYALPVAAITGVGMAFFNKESKVGAWFKFFFSLAFLFIAIGYIRNGIEEMIRQYDLSALNKYPLIVFVLAGIILTALVQSSSVTVAIVMSALYVKGINFYAAAAVVLGSEIGTTLKFFIASARGTAVQKKVAFGNFLFNIVTATVIFILLKPIVHFITAFIFPNNQVLAIVFFQSFINLASIIIFFPILKKLSALLDKIFKENEEGTKYISKVPASQSESAIEALEKETRLFISDVIDYGLASFQKSSEHQQQWNVHEEFKKKNVKEKYSFLKQVHGEMHSYYVKLQQSQTRATGERLEQIISAIRNLMYAAKNINDAQHDIQQTRDSSNDLKYQFFRQSGKKIEEFYSKIAKLLAETDEQKRFDELTNLYHSVTEGYSNSLKELYDEGPSKKVDEIEITTLINFNREIYTSFKSMIFGLKDFLLPGHQAEQFEALPGFIR